MSPRLNRSSSASAAANVPNRLESVIGHLANAACPCRAQDYMRPAFALRATAGKPLFALRATAGKPVFALPPSRSGLRRARRSASTRRDYSESLGWVRERDVSGGTVRLPPVGWDDVALPEWGASEVVFCNSKHGAKMKRWLAG